MADAGMEGGSPSLIWQRWTLPMYRAQCRYWSDHPRLTDLAMAYLGVKPKKKTPPPKPGKPGDDDPRPVDWSQLDRK